ncbi:hypothetical protein KC366_g65 [Hortaea werneckii]|nr:hypothetical protein KC366_g65 [Hortaea werneckii]
MPLRSGWNARVVSQSTPLSRPLSPPAESSSSRDTFRSPTRTTRFPSATRLRIRQSKAQMKPYRKSSLIPLLFAGEYTPRSTKAGNSTTTHRPSASKSVGSTPSSATCCSLG